MKRIKRDIEEIKKVVTIITSVITRTRTWIDITDFNGNIKLLLKYERILSLLWQTKYIVFFHNCLMILLFLLRYYVNN